MIGGSVEGNENAKINSFAKIEEGKEGAISFLSNPKYTSYIYETKSSVVLVNNDLELEHPVSCTLIRVENAYDCVAKLMQMYAQMLPKKQGIDSLAFVAKSAKIGKDVYIGPFACIGENVTIGDGCAIYPHVVIYDGCKIGNNVHSCRLGHWCRRLRLRAQSGGLRQDTTIGNRCHRGQRGDWCQHLC